MEKQTTFENHKAMKVKPFSWKKYNESQTKEKMLFLRLLREISYTLNSPVKDGGVNQGHKVFCMCLKVYLNTSGRRLISDLEICRKIGYLKKNFHFNTIFNFFNDKYMIKTLKHLIELSAIPLAQLERRFAVDSSGIAIHKYEPWISARLKHGKHRVYKKMHIIYGVLTNVAATCMITKGTANDSPHFKELLQRAADNFEIEEISADLAYSSKENLTIANKLGARPYIPFKKNTSNRSRGCMIWKKAFRYFRSHQEEFLKHYHLRSNAETGFWMIKSKFGEFVKSKNDIAQENEILCKILCHNLCCLIQEIFLQGVEVDFLECLHKFRE